MGLDLQGLQALNPGAIFCQLDCFGGIRRGPRSDYLGYENNVQAATGIMVRYGGSAQTPEEHVPIGTLDVMAGFSAAFGIAAALYQKAKTGQASRARTSLSALSGLVQMPFYYESEGRGPSDEPTGADPKGSDALTHLYETASGRTILLSALEDDLPRLAQIEGLEGFADVPNVGRISFLAGAIAKASAEQWVSRFIEADIGVAICETIASVQSANSTSVNAAPGPRQGSYSFSTRPYHPSGHAVRQVNPCAVRLAVAKVYALDAAEKYGSSTRRVLSWLEYTEAEIDDLLAAGAISERWSSEYLPS
ncbi:crotonobetainyl-CoA:carnitine CoA-transferase CaiB-like acyl-CoA transferase [Bradyrhizobium sp. LM3.2]